jgi:hypothetical protein
VNAVFTPSLSRVEGEPFPADEDVERVMDIILHARGHQDALSAAHMLRLPSSTRTARQSVIDILRKIRKCTVTHPGSEKPRLLKAARYLEKAHAILTDLSLPTDGVMDVHDACKRRAGKLVVKRTGGQIAAKAQKKIAAAEAFSLLLFVYGERPTLSRGGVYLQLATMLFVLATGRPGDLERACAACCAEFEAAGYRTPRRRK